MTRISLALLNAENQVKDGKLGFEEEKSPLQVTDEDFVYLAATDFQFEEGDRFEIVLDQPDTFVLVRLDETLPESFIFVKDKVWHYQISMTQNAREARPDQRFASKRHYASVRVARAEEINGYRNLALNPHDQQHFTGAYPHAFANVETRNDATFFACNAIDGVYGNHSHGPYPYQSWGINQQSDAALTLDFGRDVVLDQVVFTWRADFPHDSYWERVTLRFSDGTAEEFVTEKTDRPQAFHFTPRKVTSVIFCELIQAEDDSPFPALTQIELFGHEARGEKV